MTAELRLRLRDGISERVDVTGVVPEALAATDPARIPVRIGRRSAVLADVFQIEGIPGTSVRFAGALERVDGIGARCRAGAIVVEGSAGHYVGAEMTGGAVEVHGAVGDDAGIGMSGGTLRIHGSAADRLGAAFPGERRGMTGGEIIVTGSAGEGVGSLMRRGLVVVGGDVEPGAARAMIAGTLVVFGRTDRETAIANKRGTIVAIGGLSAPPSYRAACTYAPPHVRLLLLHLRRSGLTVADEMISGQYRRYCGDAGNPGKGELLEWIRPQST